jgi:hypothetical protein
VKEAPDPFTEEERDKILAFYRDKRPRWYPFVATLFWTGMRPGELAALRVADVDLERGKISITKSRDAGAEGPPKTARSRRDVTILPNLLAILKEVKHSDGHDPRTTYFFRNPDGGPITTKEWPKKSWAPVLKKKVGVRYRKFYTTPPHVHLVGPHEGDEREGDRRVRWDVAGDDREVVWTLHRERWSRSPAPMPRRDCGCEEAGVVAPQRREEEDGDGDHASVDRETDRAPLWGESGNPTGNFCLRAAERNDKQADSDEKRKWSHGESNRNQGRVL